MVGPGGFEPPSSWLKTRRPSPLDHGPTRTSLLYPNHGGFGQEGGLNAPTHRYDPPSSTASTHTRKEEAHLLPNRFCLSQNSRHANEGTSLQGDFYHQPNRSAQTHHPDPLPNGQLMRNRMTREHLTPARAQVGATLPTTRRTSTARPAQNPRAPTQKNRARQTSASFSFTRKRATDTDASPATSPSKGFISLPTPSDTS
jgi:hypothetical protein